MSATTEQVPAFNTLVRKLGHWTESRDIEIRAHRAQVVIDLRSPHIPAGDIEITLDAERSTVKLLVADDTVVDRWDLRVTGRGGVKDHVKGNANTGRRIRLTGEIRDGEIRVNRGGVAVLSALFTREFVADARRAHRDGTPVTVVDPAAEHPGR
ncbi:hypothetical protein [Phytomonospora endophytica]|uniref:Uncharacterized protein n=1 Tax=Phytomonospora endophytica TaxID=714109 RepID=A0A841G1D0_9ACTN|nr:hypothetical protein [Phytomonospora endophytica]MBB6039738.1 hypothetical protein [Phytomonospora endophytica]